MSTFICFAFISVLSNLCHGLSVWLEKLGHARTAKVFKTIAIIASFGSTLLVKFKSTPPSTTSANTFQNYNEFIPCKSFSLLRSWNEFFSYYICFVKRWVNLFPFLNLQDFVKRNNPLCSFKKTDQNFLSI